MKNIFTLLILCCFTRALAQNLALSTFPNAILPHSQHNTIAGQVTVIESDTSKENKVSRYFCFSVHTDVFTNTKGGVDKRFSPAFEYGQIFGICDLITKDNNF